MTVAAPPISQTSPLVKAMAACRGGFVAVILFSFCINVLMLTVPIYMMQVFDRVLSSRSGDTLLMLLLIATVALAVMGALDALRGFLMTKMSGWLDTSLSGTVLSEAVVAQLSRGGAPSVQGLRDLTNLRQFVTGAGVFPILDSPWAPVFIVVIFLLHPWLGALSLLGALALFALALLNETATRAPLRQANIAAQGALVDAEAAVRNADVVEAMGMMPRLIARWHRRNAEAIALQEMASNKGAAISAVSRFLRMLLQIGVLTLGAWLVLEGELSPGGMIAGSILMSRALAPVEQAIGSWKGAISARQSYDRLQAQLARHKERGQNMPLPIPKGALDVEGLVFAHPGARDALLRNISFKLAPGELLGLIGPTASGKTTLARLLVGNLTPRAGKVRLDGMDVSHWEHDDLGRHIGYLPQDVELFAGTIRENIARMDEGEPQKVVRAAQLAGVHEMILAMPDGYDTEIGTGGMTLSGGQRQRIGLARALYGNPRFVVLDEPNASLDQVGDAALARALAILKKAEVTTVVIAHRQTMLRHVDKILVLKDGGLLLFGPRDAVIAKLREMREASQAQRRKENAPSGEPPEKLQ